ncbi:MAG: 1,2-phenylacetyl-CoA epoxidase subunit PaaD [Burkholderiaceae bacterium]
MSAASLAQVRQQVGLIPDPEIPVVTLAELGILREVVIVDGRMTVILTPTYSGCPATEAIAADVQATLHRLGHPNGQVELVLAPAWTTDWITGAAREKLRAYGIAPPCHSVGAAPTTGESVLHFMPQKPDTNTMVQPPCPRCDSARVERLTEFGSTPCKSMYRCLSCREPFDYFKPF